MAGWTLFAFSEQWKHFMLLKFSSLHNHLHYPMWTEKPFKEMKTSKW